MIIDAKELIVGRIATVAAKQALLGEDVVIVNSEKAVVTGTKLNLHASFLRKRSMGTHAKGPFFPRSEDRILKRMIRGMLPYKQSKGKVAFKRIMCYKGIPSEFQGKETITIKEAHVSKVPNLKYMTLEKISKVLGEK